MDAAPLNSESRNSLVIFVEIDISKIYRKVS